MNLCNVMADLVIGTVIIVANEGSTIDIPPGSVLENVVVQGSLRLVLWIFISLSNQLLT